MQHRAQRVAHLQAIGQGKGLADQHLVRSPRIEVAAAHQLHIVEHRPVRAGHRHQLGHGWFGQSRHINGHLDHQARLHLGHTGPLAHLLGQRIRRAAKVGKHISKAVTLVVITLRQQQRLVRAPKRHQHRNATGHHQSRRHQWPAQVPQVSPQHAAEHAHHEISSGEALVALRWIATMRPLLMRITRSAMAAMAALCVMTTVIVPSA